MRWFLRLHKDKPKTYVFESANKGDIIIMNSGEYIDGSVDMAVEISETGDYEEFVLEQCRFNW